MRAVMTDAGDAPMVCGLWGELGCTLDPSLRTEHGAWGLLLDGL